MELENIYKNRKILFHDKKEARKQRSENYRKWLLELLNVPPEGRAVYLFQKTASAYRIGKTINELLPSSESPARNPEQVVKQYMINCL